MRKSLAAIVLIVLFGGIAAPVTCAGWQVSPSDRMACCQRAQHDACDNQSAADDCCAAEEQSRHAEATVIAATPAVPAPGIALFTPLFDPGANERSAATLFERAVAGRLHGPRGLFASPLRI